MERLIINKTKQKKLKRAESRETLGDIRLRLRRENKMKKYTGTGLRSFLRIIKESGEENLLANREKERKRERERERERGGRKNLKNPFKVSLDTTKSSIIHTLMFKLNEYI